MEAENQTPVAPTAEFGVAPRRVPFLLPAADERCLGALLNG